MLKQKGGRRIGAERFGLGGNFITGVNITGVSVSSVGLLLFTVAHGVHEVVHALAVDLPVVVVRVAVRIYLLDNIARAVMHVGVRP